MKNSIANKFNLILLGALILVGSCAKNDPPVDKQQKPLFPLSIGNNWSYVETFYDGDYTDSQTDQLNVLGSYTIDGITGFALNEYKKGYPISLLENDKEGNLVEHFFNNDKLVHTTILFKKNVKKGDSWAYKDVVYSDSTHSSAYNIEDVIVTCVTTDTIITVPKGDFHCIGFSYDEGKQSNGDPENTIFYFLSENIGLVKYILYEHADGMTYYSYDRVLTNYTLKN